MHDSAPLKFYSTIRVDPDERLDESLDVFVCVSVCFVCVCVLARLHLIVVQWFSQLVGCAAEKIDRHNKKHVHYCSKV